MTDPSVKSKVPHVHAAVIKAWVDGAEIQVKLAGGSVWLDCSPTGWFRNCEYRVKPPPPHKWQKEMDAYAAGKVVQWRAAASSVPAFRKWQDCVPGVAGTPHWYTQYSNEYRIKPEPVVHYLSVDVRGSNNVLYHIEQGPPTPHNCTNLKLTFEDGKLIGAEVLKC
jgi:hypothetical protein